LEEKSVLVILVLIGRFFRHGHRLIDRLDDVLVVGLDETTQDLAGFLWTNARTAPIAARSRGLGVLREWIRAAMCGHAASTPQLPAARVASR
jgi:hypothetical protein